MSDEIKKMNINEFRTKGYLQELNRAFLHPLGLALEISIDDNGTEKISGIQDHRDDPEGVIFDIENLSTERKVEMFEKRNFVVNEMNKKAVVRRKLFNSESNIEPLIPSATFKTNKNAFDELDEILNSAPETKEDDKKK